MKTFDVLLVSGCGAVARVVSQRFECEDVRCCWFACAVDGVWCRSPLSVEMCGAAGDCGRWSGCGVTIL